MGDPIVDGIVQKLYGSDSMFDTGFTINVTYDYAGHIRVTGTDVYSNDPPVTVEVETDEDETVTRTDVADAIRAMFVTLDEKRWTE